MRTLLTFACLCSLLACQGKKSFQHPQLLGGKLIDAQTLNEGEFAYMRYCRICHGQLGDGRGPHAQGITPPPRDLREGLYPRSGTPASQLPSDAALAAIIRQGIPGTAMKPLQISERELDAVVQYIKTLSLRWRTQTSSDSR